MNQDDIANEIKYHRSCFSLYKKSLKRLANDAVDSDLAQNGDVKAQAFMKLCEWIEISVLTQSNSVTDMTEVCKRYSRFLDELGLTGYVQNPSR